MGNAGMEAQNHNSGEGGVGHEKGCLARLVPPARAWQAREHQSSALKDDWETSRESKELSEKALPIKENTSADEERREGPSRGGSLAWLPQGERSVLHL